MTLLSVICISILSLLLLMLRISHNILSAGGWCFCLCGMNTLPRPVSSDHHDVIQSKMMSLNVEGMLFPLSSSQDVIDVNDLKSTANSKMSLVLMTSALSMIYLILSLNNFIV